MGTQVTDTSDRIRKAFALALNPSTPQAEQVAAWGAALRLCIAEGYKTFDDVIKALSPAPAQSEKGARFFGPVGNEPYGWDTVIPFGKHSGSTLGEIYGIDPAYIEWLHATNVRSRQLRRAIEGVHQWMEEQ